MFSGGKTFKLVLTVLWMIVLFIPLMQQLGKFNVDTNMLNEKRNKATLPKFNLQSIVSFSEKFEKYYNDNYGFRELFINLNNTIKYHIFNISGNRNAIIGKDDWFFYTGENSIDLFKGLYFFDDKTLEHLSRVYQKRSDYLKSKGIVYILLIAPDKKSIYPEYYPDHIKKVSKLSLYDQLSEYLKKHTDIIFIDLKKPLLEAKLRTDYLLYNKRGTHWNEYGAFLAYEEVVRQLKKYFPELEGNREADFNIITSFNVSPEYDMNKIIFPKKIQSAAIKWKKHDDLYDYLIKKVRNNKKNRIYGFDANTETSHFSKSNKYLIRNGLFIRDSFGDRLIPFLGRHFEKFTSYMAWPASKFNEEIIGIIENEKPDVVIQEFVERTLDIRPDNLNEVIAKFANTVK